MIEKNFIASFFTIGLQYGFIIEFEGELEELKKSASEFSKNVTDDHLEQSKIADLIVANTRIKK